MTPFVLAALALAVLGTAPLLWPLLRRPVQTQGVSASAANLAVLRQQLAELQRERATLGEARFALAEQGLQHRVLDEAVQAEAEQPARPDRRTAWLLALLVPALAGALYSQLGSAAARASWAPAPAASEAAMDDVQAMVDRLAERLASAPQDLDGWVMLARSQAALQRFPEAAQAYRRAAALAPRDAQLLADFADVLAVAQGHSAEGEPELLVARALQLDPANLKALALAGSAAHARDDVATARRHWQRALAQAEPGSPFARAVGDSLARLPAGVDPGPEPPATARPGSAGVAGQVSGRVSLGPGLAGRVAPNDTVFILARAVDEAGPRMPVAILRRTARELPITFTLDDSLAMSPTFRLSSLRQVEVVVRLSRSGDATPRSDDLRVVSGPVAVGGKPLTLVIRDGAP